MIFRAVARAGSISAAAKALGWTQPAVSQHLSRLERDIGGPLVIRGPRGVTVTEPGATLLVRADAVAAELRHADEEMTAFTSLGSGRVSLACFPSAAATILPVALRRLAAAHPGVEVSLDEAEPPEALAAVRAGDVDVALVFGYDGPPQDADGLVWRLLLCEPLNLVVPPHHPAAEQGLTALGDLSAETWIGGCERCRAHMYFCCRAAGFEPAIRYTTDDYVVAQNLVAVGLGVTMLPRSALLAHRHPEVCVLDSPTLGERHVGVIHRPGAEAVPATAALLQEVTRLTKKGGVVTSDGFVRGGSAAREG
jgi:DNA-binding transcriptional LysR family regulator